MNDQCSVALLESALAGNISAEQEESLHRHLETCETCTATLEQMAGGAAWCEEAAALLIEDELDETVPSREECSNVDFTVEHLEASDEPNVIGRLGGYDVLEIIGRGGMGVVLKGFDRELKRCVAIKVLSPHLAQSSLARKRFAREAQAAAAVVHPNVLAIHQVQPSGRLPFLVMPLVAGESLAERLVVQGRLDLKETLRIGMQAAAGLAAAHEQGLVHRDVKPANILLEKGVERAVLTDFGLARAADDVSMTRWGIIAGTPQYMSPEQAQGEPLDGRSDLFSLGCVLYEMATGVSPFRADSTVATLRRLIDDPPPAMASLNPELPPWFIGIVDRLLDKDPAKRFGSAKEVSELLEGCLAHLQQPTSVPLPAAIPKPAIRAGSRRRNIIIKGAITMIGIFGFVLLGMFAIQATDPPDITGQWSGEGWGQVVLTQIAAGEYTGSYSDTVGKEPGKIELKWSRIERRFNGKWSEGEDRFGELSIRLADQEIRGALTTDLKSKINPATPRLADLTWTKASQSKPADSRFKQKTLWGAVKNGLQMGISLDDNSQSSPSAPVFLVSFRNAGTKDANLTLAIMLANEKEQLLDAIYFSLTDAQNESRYLEFSDKRHSGIAGRVGDLVAALQASKTYVVPVKLSQCSCPSTKEFDLKLLKGHYRIAAEFNTGTERTAMMHFQPGPLQSNELEFQIGEVKDGTTSVATAQNPAVELFDQKTAEQRSAIASPARPTLPSAEVYRSKQTSSADISSRAQSDWPYKRDLNKKWPLTRKDAIRCALSNSEVMHSIGVQVIALPESSTLPASTASGSDKPIQPVADKDERVQITRLNTDISAVDFEAAVRNLVHDVESAYWELYFAHRNLDIVQTGRDLALETWQKVHARRNEGSKNGTAAEEAQAREQYFLFRNNGEQALSALYAADNKLRYILGVAPTDDRLICPSEEPTTAKVTFDAKEIRREALERNIEIRRQKMRVKQREAEVAAAKDFANSVDDQKAKEGLRNAELAATKERKKLQEAELELSHVLANAIRNVEADYALADTNFNRRVSAKSNVDAVETAYKKGTIQIYTLLQTQRLRVQAESDYYRALVNYVKSIAMVHFRKGSLLDYEGVYLKDEPKSAKVEKSENETPSKDVNKLRTPDIDLALAEATGKLEVAKKTLEAKQFEIKSDQKLTQERRNQIMGEVAELEANISGLEEQKRLLELKKAAPNTDGSGLSHVVPFEVGATYLRDGDRITIEEIRGTADTITTGNIYEIKGTYRLASQDEALLAAYTTADPTDPKVKPFNNVPSLNTQTKTIERGEGKFTLIMYMWCEGNPHLSFYAGGKSIASVYFGTGDSVLKKGGWEDKENPDQSETSPGINPAANLTSKGTDTAAQDTKDDVGLMQRLIDTVRANKGSIRTWKGTAICEYEREDVRDSEPCAESCKRSIEFAIDAIRQRYRSKIVVDRLERSVDGVKDSQLRPDTYAGMLKGGKYYEYYSYSPDRKGTVVVDGKPVEKKGSEMTPSLRTEPAIPLAVKKSDTFFDPLTQMDYEFRDYTAGFGNLISELKEKGTRSLPPDFDLNEKDGILAYSRTISRVKEKKLFTTKITFDLNKGGLIIESHHVVKENGKIVSERSARIVPQEIGGIWIPKERIETISAPDCRLNYQLTWTTNEINVPVDDEFTIAKMKVAQGSMAIDQITTTNPAVNVWPTTAPAVNPAADLKAMHGVWNVVRQLNSETADTLWNDNMGTHFDVARTSRVIFQNDKLKIRNADLELWACYKFQIDPAASPKKIDIFSEQNKDQLIAVGIYEFEGDKLKICIAKYQPALKADHRPKSFAVDAKSGDILLMLDTSADVKALHGNGMIPIAWKLVSETRNGELSPAEPPLDPTSPPRLQYPQYFDYSYVVFSTGNQSAVTGSYFLEEDKNPKRIQFHFTLGAGISEQGVITTKDIVLRGIYKMEGDRLTIAYREDDKPLEKFDSTTGSIVTLLELKRGEPKQATDAVPASDNSNTKSENAREEGKLTAESWETDAAARTELPAATEAERAISRLVLVFFRDGTRRAIPAVLVNAGSRTLIVTTGPATIIPEGTPPAIDRAFLEFPERSAVKAEYLPESTKELSVYHAERGLTSYRPDNTVKLAAGDVLSAIILGSSPEFSIIPNAARVAALEQQADLNLPKPLEKVQHYDQLVEIDRSLPEGTPLFKDGKLAGITLLGKRFLGEESNKSYVVPADRIAALCSRIKAAGDNRENTASDDPKAKNDQSGKAESAPANPIFTLDGKPEKQSLLAALREKAGLQSVATSNGEFTFHSVAKAWRSAFGKEYQNEPLITVSQGKVYYDEQNYYQDEERQYTTVIVDKDGNELKTEQRNEKRGFLLTPKWFWKRSPGINPYSSDIRVWDPPGDFRSYSVEPRLLAKVFIGDEERLNVEKGKLEERECYRLEEVSLGSAVRSVQYLDPEKNFIPLRKETYYDNTTREQNKLRDDYPFQTYSFEYRKDDGSDLWLPIKIVEQHFETIPLAENRNPTLDRIRTTEFSGYSFKRPPANVFNIYHFGMRSQRLVDNRKGHAQENWYDLPGPRDIADPTFVPKARKLPTDIADEWLTNSEKETSTLPKAAVDAASTRPEAQPTPDDSKAMGDQAAKETDKPATVESEDPNQIGLDEKAPAPEDAAKKPEAKITP